MLTFLQCSQTDRIRNRNKIGRAQPPSNLLKQGKKELIHMTDKRPDQTLFYLWSMLQNSDRKPVFLAFKYRLLQLTHEAVLCSCYVVMIGLLCTMLKMWSLSKVAAHLSSFMTWGVIYVCSRNAVVWVTRLRLIVRIKGHMIQVWVTIIVMLHSQNPWQN